MIKLPQWQVVADENHEWQRRCVTDHVRPVSAMTFDSPSQCLLDSLRSVGAACRVAEPEAGHHQDLPVQELRVRLRNRSNRAKRAH